jgi:hypothetical protein
MTTVIGPPEGKAYILATLQADAQQAQSHVALSSYVTQIFSDVAPQAAINAPPYILVRYQGGADVLGSFADFIMTSGLYQVAIFGPDTLMSSTLVPAARLIHANLHRTSGTAQGGNILASYREQPLDLPEVISGSDIQWRRVGGIYRVLVS